MQVVPVPSSLGADFYGSDDAANSSVRINTDRFVLYLDDKVFAVCWWLVVLLHTCDIAFLVASTWMVYWLLHDANARFFLLDLLSFDISHKTLDRMNWVFAGVAGLHCLALLLVLYQSLRARRLDLDFSMPFTCWVTALDHQRSRMDGSITAFVRKCDELAKKWIEPVFFIHGNHFEDYFLVHECFEVMAQVYQANKMGKSIATRWINNVFVAMICINCLSTPLLHRLVPPSRAPLRRLLAITMSAFLNFINSVVIPLVIFSKYILAYVPGTYSFSDDKLFGDIWYPQAIRENNQLFVTSLVDFVFTVWPHCMLLRCLVTCEQTLRRVKSDTKSKTIVTKRIKVNPRDCTKIPPRIQLSLPRGRSSTEQSATPRVILKHVLWLSGVAVLGIHIDAQMAPRATGCVLDSTPWFGGSKTSCVVFNLNCYRRGIEGNESDIEAILRPLNPDTMDTLIITHCPRLGIPPIIRDFPQLYGIEIYNSTIDQWPARSSPRRQDYVYLEYTFIVLTNLTSLPEGLLQEDFPCEEVYFSGCNLTSLPDSIKHTWTDLTTLVLEHCLLEDIPPVVLEMPLQSISLTGSPLRGAAIEQSKSLFGSSSLLSLRFSGCPITSLPSEAMGSMGDLYRLALEYTALEAVPLFIQQWYLANMDVVDHSLFGSPFCTKPFIDGSGMGMDEVNERLYHDQVCSEDHKSLLGRYPIQVVMPQRPP